MSDSFKKNNSPVCFLKTSIMMINFIFENYTLVLLYLILRELSLFKSSPSFQLRPFAITFKKFQIIFLYGIENFRKTAQNLHNLQIANQIVCEIALKILFKIMMYF